MYRYELKSKDPITKRTHKVDCPVCHAKKRFTEYWDNLTGQYVAGSGMCDRVNGCGAHIRPSQVTDNSTHSPNLSYSALYAMNHFKMASEPVTAEIVPLNPLYERLRDRRPTTLVNYLEFLFGTDAVKKAMQIYGVTGDGHGGAMFWQNDGMGTITTGRAICYNDDGHRDKNINPYWAHNKYQLPDGYQPPKYPFGLHLCTDGARVAIVESEKTAVMCYCYNMTEPDNDLCSKYDVFMASGGLQFLRMTLTNGARILSAAESVVLIPDDDEAFDRWQKIASEYNGIGANIGVDDAAHRTNETNKKGFDIGDAIEARIIASIKVKQIENYLSHE